MKLMTRLLAITAIASATLLAMSTASANHGGSSVTPTLGFTKSAVNLGGQYDKGMDSYDMGGYIFIQTNKDKNSIPVVNQVLSFGGQMKVHVAQTAKADVYVAPGVGLHMIKDVYDTATAKKDDVTTIGPTLRVGALFAITPTVKAGIERLDLVNWFDDKAGSQAVYTYYAAALSFGF